MARRVTVRFDDDVLEALKLESRLRGTSFQETTNCLLRAALASPKQQMCGRFYIESRDMGYRPELNYDDIEALIELSEGPDHR